MLVILCLLAPARPYLNAQDAWCEIASPANGPFPQRHGMSTDRLDFVDAENGWMIARYYVGIEQYANVYRTKDSAASWTNEWQGNLGGISTKGRLHALSMVDPINGWVCGDRFFATSSDPFPYLMYRLKDSLTGEIRWEYQETGLPAGNALRAVWAFDADRALIASTRGIIARTSDAGRTWTQIDTVAPNLLIEDMFFVDDEYGWIYSWDQLYKTTDGGYSWTNIPYGSSFLMMSMYFHDRMNGSIGGEAGNLMRTTDGGLTWLRQDATTSSRVEDIEFLDLKNGFAVCGGVNTTAEGWLDSSRVLKTTNGGSTWTQMPHPRDSWINDMDLVDAKHGYIVTGRYFYHYCGDELVSVQEDLPREPCQCKRALYDYLGREVDARASGMLLEYDPCVGKARLVVR